MCTFLGFAWLPVLSREFRAPGSWEPILVFASFPCALGLTSLSLYPLTTIFLLLESSAWGLCCMALSPGRNMLTALACVALANSGEPSDLQEAGFHPCPLQATAPQPSYKATPLLSLAMDLVSAPKT